MRSYLSLVSISAKVHKRRNRMTLLCIIFAVFLITGVFSLADAGVESLKRNTIYNHGNWHIQVEGVSKSDAEEIAARKDVAVTSWYEVVNLKMSEAAIGEVGEDYKIAGRKTALCGIQESFVTDIMQYFSEGATLDGGKGIILSGNAKELLGVDVGDSVTLDTPAGSYAFTVSGFRRQALPWVGSNGGESSALLVGADDIGAFISIEAFREITKEEKPENLMQSYYVRFAKHANIKRAASQIGQYGEILQNKMLMITMGEGKSSYIWGIYGVAAFLFVLVMMAGIFMISGSLNSNVAERSRFFGMMRCIGASRKQIIRFVRVEALLWCKTAIPVGVLLGTVVSWGLSAFIKYFIGGEFSQMPVLRVSVPGILSGVIAGIVTVLLAAQAPAKRASKVSPVAAVSGNSSAKNIRRAANIGFFKIETALGIHHAVSAKKNLILLMLSFSLSIIMFLSFSVLIDFLGILMPTKAYAPDISIIGTDYTNTVDASLIEKLNSMTGIKEAFGRTSVLNIPAAFSKETEKGTINLISYDELQLNWLEEDGDLRKGSDASKVMGDSNYVLTIYDKSNPLGIGDKIYVGDTELTIAGVLKNSPFSNDGTTGGEIDVICSKETHIRLTGEENYAMIDIHVTKDITEEEIYALDALAKEMGNKFLDRREEGNSKVAIAFQFMIYGFLSIIVLITIFNIMNSISLGVSARIRQYGAMRAVGMDGRQITRTIAAESLTYAFFGCVVGCGIGLPASKAVYSYLITEHFGESFVWSVPVLELLVILLLVLASVVMAVYAPSKRIRGMAVTDTINEL